MKDPVMNDPLATYLADHLAGAVQAIKLLKHIREEYAAQPLGQFASSIVTKIEKDRNTLRSLAERVGSVSSAVKRLTAWLGEKVSRIKLGHQTANSLGTFEALEFLTLGIHGKLSLWRALAVISSNDRRLKDVDYAELIARAESQHARVEEHRLLIAHTALHLAPE